MNFENYLAFNLVTPVGLTSWAFLMALTLKVFSTAYGLRMKMKNGAQTEVPSTIWWLSKLSALLLSLTAALLCHYAGDKRATFAFLALSLAATVLVAMLAARRHEIAPAAQ